MLRTSRGPSEHIADQISNKYLKSTETSISLQSSHFLMKIFCSSLISGQKQRLVAHLTYIGSYQELLDAYCGLSFYLHTFLCVCMQRRLLRSCVHALVRLSTG